MEQYKGRNHCNESKERMNNEDHMERATISVVGATDTCGFGGPRSGREEGGDYT